MSHQRAREPFFAPDLTTTCTGTQYHRPPHASPTQAAFMQKLKSTNVIEFREVEQKNSREVHILMEFAAGE
jgi:hypothetical protein